MMLYKHTNDFLRQSAPQRSGIALVSHGKTQLPLTAKTDSSRPLTSSPEREGPPVAGLVSLPPHFGRITEPGDWFWCWSAGGSEVRTNHRFPRRDEEAVLKLEVTSSSTTAYTAVLTCRATAVGTRAAAPCSCEHLQQQHHTQSPWQGEHCSCGPFPGLNVHIHFPAGCR